MTGTGQRQRKEEEWYPSRSPMTADFAAANGHFDNPVLARPALQPIRHPGLLSGLRTCRKRTLQRSFVGQSAFSFDRERPFSFRQDEKKMGVHFLRKE